MGLELRAGSIFAKMPKVPAFMAASPEMTSTETMSSRFFFFYCLLSSVLCDYGFLVPVIIEAIFLFSFIADLRLILMIWKFKMCLVVLCFSAELAISYSFSFLLLSKRVLFLYSFMIMYVGRFWVLVC